MRWFVLALMLTGPAHGYVRSTTDGGDHIRWRRACMGYHLHEAGSADVGDALLLSAVQASFEAWNEPACSDLSLVYRGRTSDDFVGYSFVSTNANVVSWQETAWPHARGVIALTTVTFCAEADGGICLFEGEAVDADIEFNGVDFGFSTAIHPRERRYDVRNTLTHEVGHFFGLDHTLVPGATMVATAPQGETSKASLHTDDIAGLCALYPAPDEPVPCEILEPKGDFYPAPVGHIAGGGGCRVGGGGGGALAPLLLLLAIAGRRRRRG